MTTLNSLDVSVLESLRELGSDSDPGFLKTLLDAFIASARQQLPQFKTAVRLKDYVVLGAEAHTLKSSSANVGALALSKICQRLELISAEGKNGNDVSPQAQDALAHLEKELAQVLTEISSLPEMKN